jgi:hypothetical protein
MMNHRMTGWQAALLGITATLALPHGAAAQDGASDAGERGACTRSPAPHDECPARCPTYDTCIIDEGRQLYYRVDGERFECDGLDCRAASDVLADYCCSRGQFAPSEKGKGGGGCSLGGAGSIPERSALASGSAWLGTLAVLLVGRRRRPRGGPAPNPR